MTSKFKYQNIISITELQKLSMKRLRKSLEPILVLDRKSKKQGFVILDLKTYEELQNITHAKKGAVKRGAVPDFRGRGLLWDRPGMTNRKFLQRLKDQTHREYAWAIKRLFEYTPSTFVVKILSMDELQFAVASVKLKPIYQEAWNNVIQYWTKAA